MLCGLWFRVHESSVSIRGRQAIYLIYILKTWAGSTVIDPSRGFCMEEKKATEDTIG